MINFLLKNPSLYRFYQKIVRAKYDEYDFFRFIFKQNNFKNMRMLDICCGDSYILEYINEFVDDYLGIDSNDKYLKQCQLRWKNFNFINLDLNDKTNIDHLTEWMVIVREDKHKVNLYCPTCWDSAKQAVEDLKSLSETSE